MDFLGSASRDQLILTALSSEWDRTHSWRPIIDYPDLADSAQNTTRARMLFSNRRVILEELPYEMRPEWVSIPEDDLANLPVDHLAKVDAITSSLLGYNATTASEALILISTNRDWPMNLAH